MRKTAAVTAFATAMTAIGVSAVAYAEVRPVAPSRSEVPDTQTGADNEPEAPAEKPSGRRRRPKHAMPSTAPEKPPTASAAPAPRHAKPKPQRERMGAHGPFVDADRDGHRLDDAAGTFIPGLSYLQHTRIWGSHALGHHAHRTA